MRSINKAFYKSKAWTECRRAYLKEHPLCECCLANGIYTPAQHVHHKKHLNRFNEHDASITLNFDNLEALCVPCHNQRHGHTEATPRRYVVDEKGNLILLAGTSPMG